MIRYDSRRARLLVAVAAAVAATLLQTVTDSIPEPSAPWLWFILAVAVSAWFGGLKPGLITASPLLALGYYLDAARGAESAAATVPFSVPAAPSPVFAAVLFASTALVICTAMQRLRMEHFKSQDAGRRLHDVLESTQDAILSIDSDFRCLYANARAGHVAKKEPAHLHGKSLRTLFPETPSVSIYRELHRSLREGAPVHFEDKVEASNRWYEFDAYPVGTGLNLFVRDITARKAGEQMRTEVAAALEREHLRLETVMRELPVGIVIASTEMRIELVNQKAAEIFDQQFEPGDSMAHIRSGQLRTLGGEVLEQTSWPLRRTLITGDRVTNLEVEYTTPEGGSATLIINSIPLTDADGKVRAAMGTYADVTSLREVQKALGKSEARLRRLFDSPIIGVISGNEESILEANDAFLTMLGYSREDLANGKLRWAEITPPEFLCLDDVAIRQMTERGFTDPFEKEYIAKDGRRVPVLLGSTSYDRGNWAPWIGWVLDRSENQRLETRLREAAKLESIGLLAGGIAHDFNNILTSILGNTSLAHETLPPYHRARGLLENAIQSTERAADLTRQLLAYAGKGRFVIRAVDISRLTHEIGQLIRTSIPRNVELDLRLPPDLPPVEADATQLHQLIMNLIINGAEAVGDASGNVQVSVGTLRLQEPLQHSAGLEADLKPGEYVSIEIRDDGCGMDAETLKRIFDPFFTTKFTGRGLGLAAATGIVRAHKGAILVESTPGAGSFFRVLLPAARAGETKPAAPDGSPVPAPGAGTILVIDDEDVVRKVAKSSLERYGYTVLLANNGREALDIYRGLYYSVSIVILDLTMPRMSGEETLANLITINPRAKILLISGFDETETLGRFAGKGLAGFLQKPFSAAELAARVQEILNGPPA